MLLPVGVVDSAALLPVVGAPPGAWLKVIGEGLCLKTREPLRCRGLSLASFSSGGGLVEPEEEAVLERNAQI